MSGAAQTEAANATEASRLIAKYLGQAEWDLAHQVITSYRRAHSEDDPRFIDLDPSVMRVLIHLEHAVLLPPSEAGPEWDRAHQVITECRRHFEAGDAPMQPADVWELSLAELGIEVRVVNVLERELISTVADVLGESKGRLLAVPSFGPKWVTVIAEEIYKLRELLIDESNRSRYQSHVEYDWHFYLQHHTWPIHSA
jgi:hypothetical protein